SPTLADQTVSIQPLEPVALCNAQAPAISSDIRMASVRITENITTSLTTFNRSRPGFVMANTA
ncbi:MAG TPA: hypothetical protein DCW88_00130, partial [Agrobacterium sp.]|nr:hypothetical protein [Agrobacterium sp.]